jgi:CelD/BcsL family acetyltransferase involved in cellulose biosynthesis
MSEAPPERIPAPEAPPAALQRSLSPLVPGAALPAWWAPLFEQSANGSIFLSPAWLATWLEVYGHEFTGTWVRWTAAVDGVDGGTATVGGCLVLRGVVRRKGLRLNTVFINIAEATRERSPIVEFNAPLCLPGFAAAVSCDLGAYLAGQPWHCLQYPGHECTDEADALLARLPAMQVANDRRPAPFLDLAGLPPGPLLDRFSRGTRQNLRRGLRLYRDLGGEPALTRAGTLAQALEDLDRLAALHNDTWMRRGRSGAFAHEAYRRFQRHLVERLWDQGAVDLLCARAGDRVIGYLLNLVWRGKVCFVQSGFDYGVDHRLQPGMVTVLLAIEHYRRDGLREFDFLAGEARYKRVFATTERMLDWTIVYRRSLSMRMLLGANDALRRLAGGAPGPSVAAAAGVPAPVEP